MSNVTSSNQADTADGESFLMLLWTMFRMNFLLMIRYRLNFVMRILAMYVFFAIIFFGGQRVIQNVGVGIGAIGSTLDAVIVGWFLWTMSQSAYSGLSSVVTQESRWGTLEQLYMSPHGFGRIMGAKIVVNLTISLLIGTVLLVLMLLTSRRSLTLDVVTVLPLVVLTLASVIGIGFIFGGLALIYKKISSVSSLMQIALIGLVAAPAADIFGLRFLPLVQGSSMLQSAMRDGVALWAFEPLQLGILVGTAVGYLGVGYFVFQICSRVARERGVMGHY